MLIKNTKDLSNHKHLHNDVCVSLRHNTLSPSILAQTCLSNITGRRVPKRRVMLTQNIPLFSTGKLRSSIMSNLKWTKIGKWANGEKNSTKRNIAEIYYLQHKWIFCISACCANCPGDVNWWLDNSNHVTGQFVAEVTATDVITVIRPS